MIHIKKSLGVVFILCLSCITQVYADDFDKGIKAYDKGDYELAFKHMEKSANAGVLTAKFNLASMYANGKGVKQNYKKAIAWFEDAAKQGSIKSRYVLGRFYLEGLVVEKDNIKAFYWLYHAAKFGHTKAQTTLADMYRNGDLLVKNEKEFVFWLKSAAENGDKRAQSNLGVYYYQKLNLELAYKWWSLSAMQGDEKSSHNVKILEEKISQSELDAGKLLVEQWKAKHHSKEK